MKTGERGEHDVTEDGDSQKVFAASGFTSSKERIPEEGISAVRHAGEEAGECRLPRMSRCAGSTMASGTTTASGFW
jgi:hypothetical protein